MQQHEEIGEGVEAVRRKAKGVKNRLCSLTPYLYTIFAMASNIVPLQRVQDLLCKHLIATKPGEKCLHHLSGAEVLSG